MTVGLVFHFEDNSHDVFSGRQDDLEAFRYACKAFNVIDMVMIDKCSGGTQAAMQDQEINFEKYCNLEDFEAAHSGDTFIYLECEWTCLAHGVTPKKLHVDFVRPDDTNTTVWYILGPAQGFVPNVNDGRTWVSIPQHGMGAMHATHIAGILFYDMWTGCGPGMM